MKLACGRFQTAGMGAEMHAATPEQLESIMSFRPSAEAPVILHLPRKFNLLDQGTQDQVLNFATRFTGRIYGLVVHDHPAMVSQTEEYLRAARSVNKRLSKVANGPLLFIEYAVGLEPNEFIAFFARVAELDRVSACIDIGHVGIRAARNAFAATHHGEDVCSLKEQPARVCHLMPEIDAALAGAVFTVADLVASLGSFKKPVHFHLHDGHPLSTFSPFGVSDHLSFFAEIPLNFEYRGRRVAPTMFGPEGLAAIVSRALETISVQNLSFTLEIHPNGGRLTLDDAAPLFAHWTDKTNAEHMNHWLSVLCRNHRLLVDSIQVELARRRS